ncbi:hypothetical protein [Yoonia sp. 208BN28-4]|uniref:hypothetical protein n=1 Tax=Yoonia sp. 208BN28-4 TaxID=3126505 RepID=UPI0030B22B70
MVGDATMKVVEITGDQIILDDTPWFFSLIFAGFCLVLLGVGMSMIFGGQAIKGIFVFGLGLLVGAALTLIARRARIYLNRPLDLLEIRTRTFRGNTIDRHRLSDLRTAIVQSMGGDKQTHRLAFMLDTTTVPATGAYTSGNKAHLARDAVNAWLASVDSTAPRE